MDPNSGRDSIIGVLGIPISGGAACFAYHSKGKFTMKKLAIVFFLGFLTAITCFPYMPNASVNKEEFRGLKAETPSVIWAKKIQDGVEWRIRIKECDGGCYSDNVYRKLLKTLNELINGKILMVEYNPDEIFNNTIEGRVLISRGGNELNLARILYTQVDTIEKDRNYFLMIWTGLNSPFVLTLGIIAIIVLISIMGGKILWTSFFDLVWGSFFKGAKENQAFEEITKVLKDGMTGLFRQADQEIQKISASVYPSALQGIASALLEASPEFQGIAEKLSKKAERGEYPTKILREFYENSPVHGVEILNIGCSEIIKFLNTEYEKNECQRDFEKITAYCQELYANEPLSAVPFILDAVHCCLPKNDYAKAEYLLGKAEKMDEANAEIYNWKGVICEDRGKYIEAEKNFEKAAQLNGELIKYRLNLARVKWARWEESGSPNHDLSLIEQAKNECVCAYEKIRNRNTRIGIETCNALLYYSCLLGDQENLTRAAKIACLFINKSISYEKHPRHWYIADSLGFFFQTLYAKQKRFVMDTNDCETATVSEADQSALQVNLEKAYAYYAQALNGPIQVQYEENGNVTGSDSDIVKRYMKILFELDRFSGGSESRTQK